MTSSYAQENGVSATNGTATHGTTTNGTHRRTRPRPAESLGANWLPQRERLAVNIEEDAGETLRLGDFEDVPTLSVSEARFLLEAITLKRVQDGRKWQDTEITHKMQAYVDTFSRFRNHEQITEVDLLFGPFPQVNLFERSQLKSLCPGDAEEAKALIPSLQTKMSDDELDQLVQDITAARSLA